MVDVCGRCVCFHRPDQERIERHDLCQRSYITIYINLIDRNYSTKDIMAQPGTSRQPRSDDWSSTVDSISAILDEKIYYPLFSKQVDQWQVSLSGLAELSKISKKLTNVKVGTAILGLFMGLSAVRFFASGDVRCVLYGIAALDLFRISYNSYARMYVSIIVKQCTTSQIGDTIVSLFSGRIKNDALMRQLTGEINWTSLIRDTITYKCFEQVSKNTKNTKCVTTSQFMPYSYPYSWLADDIIRMGGMAYGASPNRLPP